MVPWRAQLKVIPQDSGDLLPGGKEKKRRNAKHRRRKTKKTHGGPIVFPPFFPSRKPGRREEKKKTLHIQSSHRSFRGLGAAALPKVLRATGAPRQIPRRRAAAARQVVLQPELPRLLQQLLPNSAGGSEAEPWPVRPFIGQKEQVAKKRGPGEKQNKT